jgi:hypothetical protein
MSTKITYYAIVDDHSSREKPSGVLRRTATDDGQNDEQFGYDLEWSYSPLLYSFERGNLDNKLYEIGADEAELIVERIRGSVAGDR